MNRWSQYPMLTAQPGLAVLPFPSRFFSFEKAVNGTRGQFFIFKGRGDLDTAPCYKTIRPQGPLGMLDLIDLESSEVIATIIPYSNGWGVAESSHTMATHRLKVVTGDPRLITFTNYYRSNQYTVDIDHDDTGSVYKILNAAGSRYGEMYVSGKGNNVTRRLDVTHAAEAAGKEVDMIILYLLMVLSFGID